MKIFIQILMLLFITLNVIGQSNLTIDWSTATANAAETEWTVSVNDPACPGSPIQIVLSMAGSGVDDIRTSSTGPVGSGADQRLNTYVNFDSYAESLQYTITFNKPVTNVGFKIFQVDRTAKATSPANYQDQVTFGGSPTITHASASANFQTISGNVVTGIDNIVTTSANNAPNVSYGSSTLTNISLDWRNGPDAGNFAGYSGQLIGIGNISFTTTGCALPVEVASFQAAPVQEGVAINWNTTKEQDNDYFEVQRSRNSKNFEPLAQLKGIGNSNEKNKYLFKDSSPFAGWNYYRLKQVDFGGGYSFTKIIAIFYTPSVSDIAIYPNPAQYYFKIKNSFVPNTAVQVYDITGRLILQTQSVDDNVDISKLPNGMYIVEISDKESTSKHRLYVAK